MLGFRVRLVLLVQVVTPGWECEGGPAWVYFGLPEVGFILLLLVSVYMVPFYYW